MNKLKEYKVKIEQKSSFPKEIPFGYFRHGAIKCGSYVGRHLQENKINDDSFIFYDNNHIGRGIKALYARDNFSFIELTLSLPTSFDEINLFIETCLYISQYWTCSFTFNQKHIMTSTLKELQESWQIENTRLIKDVINEIKTNADEVLILPCAKYELFFGAQEADLLYPVTSSKDFGLWLHDKQEKTVYVPDLMNKMIYHKSNDFIVIPLDIPCLIPNTKDFYQTSDNLHVSFYDNGQELCFIPYNLFLMYLPRQKTFYFDSCQKLVSSFEYEDISCLISEDLYD